MAEVKKSSQNFETVLHLVAESALHDLVEKAAENVSKMDTYLQTWNTIVANSVDWWCLKNGKKKHYKSSKDYREDQRDAIYHLRSVVSNKQDLSVIQLAATRGLVKFVKEMIWVKKAFVEDLGEYHWSDASFSKRGKC